MIENEDRAVEADPGIGQLEIVDGAASEFRFDEIFEVVAPKSETTAERKGMIHFVEEFVAGHEFIEQMPGIAVTLGDAFTGLDGAVRARAAEGEKGAGDDEGVAGLL